MGSDVLFEGHRTLTVSGVIENYPYQSHLAINMLAHFDLLLQRGKAGNTTVLENGLAVQSRPNLRFT